MTSNAMLAFTKTPFVFATRCATIYPLRIGYINDKILGYGAIMHEALMTSNALPFTTDKILYVVSI